jgi:PAS domain S-box-containing protein
LTDPDGRLFEVNEMLCRILGRSAAELRTLTYAAIVHPDDYGREAEHLARMLAGREPGYSLEQRYVRPDGEVRWVAVRASLVGEDGHHVIRRTLDVTGRRRAERQRDRLFNRAPDLIAVAGLDGFLHRVNPAHTRVLGWSAEELQSLGWRAIIHPDDLDGTIARMAKLAAGMEVDTELRVRCRNGRYRWLSMRVVPDLDDGLFYAYSRDVTERKVAEEALARSEKQTQRMFYESPIGMAVTDADLRFVKVNAAFSGMLGYTQEELVRRSFAEVTHPEDVTVHAGLARRLLAGEIPGYDIENRYIRRDGDIVWGRLRATAVEFGADGLPHHLAMVEDITEVHRAEAFRREYDDLKDAFLRVVSHDLHGPLAAIAALAEVLASPESTMDTDAPRDVSRRIASQTHRLQHLVDTFLDLDRLYHDGEAAARRPTDLVALIRRVVQVVDLGDRPLVIEAETPLVPVDPDQVERIFENLLANTVAHTPPGIPVWIRVTGDDVVSLVVEDAGPGVPDHLKESVFELFRTADSETRRGGTGLWVVNRLAELHGGRAWVEDRPGGGASFHVLLPSSGTEDAHPSVTLVAEGPDVGVRVFLLDDHEFLRIGLRAVIDAQPDLLVVGEAATADEALALIPVSLPDVAVIDLQLPQGDGIEVCREISIRHPEVRCVVLSAFSYRRAVLGAMSAGAAGYLLKQRASGQLVDAIRTVVSGGTVFESLSPSARDPAEFDPRLHRLSPQERQILALIVEGRTNRQIAADLFLSEKTVKNYISRLLGKLGMARRSEAAGYGARLAERGELDPSV